VGLTLQESLPLCHLDSRLVRPHGPWVVCHHALLCGQVLGHPGPTQGQAAYAHPLCAVPTKHITALPYITVSSTIWIAKAQEDAYRDVTLKHHKHAAEACAVMRIHTRKADMSQLHQKICFKSLTHYCLLGVQSHVEDHICMACLGHDKSFTCTCNMTYSEGKRQAV
jgi:hypothetical protein